MATKPGLESKVHWNARKNTYNTLGLLDQLDWEEEQEEEQQRKRNADSAVEAMDLVRTYGDYGLERRAAEMPQPVKEERQTLGPNALTPEMEARRQAAAGVNRAPNAYQTYMMQATNAAPAPEETRSDRQLLSDAVRQGILARGTDRMASDLVFGRKGASTPSEQMLGISNQGIQSRLYDPTYTARLSASGQQMEAQREKADQAQNLYDTVTTQRQAQRELEKYFPLMSNPDFAENSQGDARIADKGPVSSMSDAERLYKNIFHRNDTYKENNALSVSPAQYVTDEEAAIFFYLWNTQGPGRGPKAAQAYYNDYVANRASERKAGAVQTQAYNYGQYDPIGASVASVGTNLASGVGLLDIAFQNLTRLAGITSASKPINYNSGFQMPGIATDSLRQGASDYLVQAVTDEIKRALPGAKNPEKYAKVANFLYQTGMSMADSSVAIALNLMGVPEPLTLAAMGSAAGTRAIQDARERGATDGQALAFGISSAIMEALFEKISLDKILEPSYAVTARAHFANAVSQSITEGSEEVMTTLANTAMDQLIMGDKSELFARQRELMEQGVSEKEALGAAFKQWGTEVLGDALGGLISGAGMGGAKEVGTGLGVFAQGVRQDMQTARALTDYQNAQRQAAPQQDKESTIVNDNPTQHTKAEQKIIDEYKNSTDNNLLDAFNTYYENRQAPFSRHKISNVSQRQAADASRILGGDYSGFTNNINKNGINHIIDEHGPQGRVDHSMADLNDAARIGYVLDNYDTVEQAVYDRTGEPDTSAEFRDRNNRPAPMLKYSKKVNGTYYVVEAVPDTNYKKFWVVGAYMGNNTAESLTQAPDAQGPRNTPEASLPSQLSANENVPQAGNTVKGGTTLRVKESPPPVPRQQAPLTIRGANATVEENRQEVNNNVDIQPQAQAASDSEGNSFYTRARQNAAGRQGIDGSERRSGVGRLLQDLRNYRTVRGAESREAEAKRIRTDADVRNQREVSAKELGVGYGTDNKTARLLDNDFASRQLGRDWTRAVAEYAKMGVKLQAITGQLERQLPGGQLSMVRAYVSGDGKTITVQVDHPTLTWNQLLDHEETHRLIKEDAAYKKAVQEALLADEKLRPYLADILRRYNEKYNEVDPNMTADEVAEEMLADYRAGFDMLDPLGLNSPTRAKAAKIASKDIKGVEKERYKTNGGKPAPADIEENFAEAKNSVEPPYRLGTKAAQAFEDGLNEQARSVYDMFLNVRNASLENTAVMSVGAGKKAHPKRVTIADRFLTAADWNDQVKSDPEFAQAAKNIFSVIPESIRKNARLNDDGTISETEFEKRFKMARSLVQRLVDALPKGVVGSTVELDGKSIQVARGRVTASVGGEEYRRALIAEKRRLYEEGSLPTRAIGTLSHDNWGAMGFLATNTKTIASGDFTTFCPQMYFNDGCWYCYRRAALTSGVNNKLTAETVWYAGEILQLRQADIDRLNQVGGLRIQSFGDWMTQYSTMLADMLIDAEKVGLQIKIITKEPSMIDTVALLKEQGLGKSLYFNLSADYTIEKRGKVDNTNTSDALPMNPERPFMQRENESGKEETWWKRALTVQEANEYRKMYPWVNTRIVATNLDEFIRGLSDPTVDVVTGYHGDIRQQERVSSETGETLLDVEPLGDAGMPRFAYDRKTGEWALEYEGKSRYQKQLAQRIQEEGLEREYYTKSCCIFGRCAKCQGKCGSYARSFAVKNATNRDQESVKYWQREMESGVDNPLLESQQEGKASTEIEAPYNRTALLSEETVDRWLKDYAAKSSPKYAQAYVTRMSPDQFLKLTTSRTGRLTISSQTGPMDAEQLIKSTQEQPLQLIIRDGEVVGHEGRHRVTALSRANVQSIPVLVFDSSNKYSKTDVPEMVLQGQDFGSSRSYDRVTLENLTPLSYENRDKIVQAYGKQDAFERSAEKLGYRQTMKFSTEIDTDYLSAVNSGDMETAQKMVDEAAKEAGYNLKVYHGTANGGHFTLFDPRKLNNSKLSSQIGQGFYFTNNKKAAKDYTRNTNIYGKTTKGSDPYLFSGYLRLTNPLEITLDSHNLNADTISSIVAEGEYEWFLKSGIPQDLQGKEIDGVSYTKNELAAMSEQERVDLFAKYLANQGDKYALQHMVHAYPYNEQGRLLESMKKHLGRDGVVWRMNDDTVQYVAFDSSQFKESDPVTYDDEGNVIPLSERFNTEKEDIRYSIEIDPEVAAQFSPEAIARRQNNRAKGVKGERKVSRVRSNTYDVSGLFNEVEAQMDEADEENYTYDVVSEKRSMNEALGRLKADFDGEVSKLSEADRQWGGSDLDTAMGILHRYRTEGRATGDYTDFWNWSKTIQEKGTKGGQFIQAFAKYTRTGTGTAAKAASDLFKQNRLNPAEQKRIKGHVENIMNGMDSQGAADDAMKQAKGKKEPTRKQDGKVDKKRLDAETQRRKDAERMVREIYNIFSRQQNNHGEPVENWLKLTGEELAKKIASRFDERTPRPKTTMQTILSDLVGFAQEHAMPDRKRTEGERRTAIDTITDYLSNRDAYGTAWAQAQAVLRGQYAGDQEKLDALEGFLGATIAYNAEGTDRTMLDAILQSADVLGISEKRILELASAGATESTISRIGDELVSQVQERMGADWQEEFGRQLKDAVRRHITGIALSESASEQSLRLGRMETAAARQLDINLQKILTESRLTKQDAARRVADYLIRELGIPSSDAAIAAQRISESFMDELAARADRRLGQMFADKTPKAREQRDKLLDLLRLGGFTNANVEDAVVDALGIGKVSREDQKRITGDMARFGETLDAIMDDDLDGLRALIREQAAARNTPLSRQAEKVLAGETDAEYLRDFALAQLDAIAGDYAALNPGAKISTFQTISHLLNMRTALRNLTSNQVFDLVDSAANNLATIPDMVIGAFTGKRTVGVNKSWLSEMKRAGAKQGAGRNLLEVRLDVSPDDRQKSKYGTAGRRTNSMASSNAFGRILSHLEEVMGYELNTTDEFHKGSVRGETLESLARFVERGDITQEQANAWAEEEALYRSFQDDTLVGNIMGELKTLLNVIGFGDSGKKNSRGRTIHDFGLGDLVVKYTQVPGALIHRGIEYSPLGYAKMVYDLAIAKDSLVRTQKRGEDVANAQRKLALDIGRATTGSGLITLFAVLAKAGLLRRDDDDKDKNAKAMHAAQGLSGTQLNVTALGRWIGGEDAEPQDGDVLADIGFLEPLDSLMTIATLLANDKDLSLSDIGVKSLDGVWKAISNTSAMQTISNIISTVQYHDEANDLPLYFQIPIEIASDSISGFIPSPVRQLAQATDTTYRDQYRSKNVNDQIRAKVANSIPGVRTLLAPKITPLGEDKKYQKPLLNYLNATLNPGNVSVYQASNVVDELNRVYGETEDSKIWPERNAPYSFTANEEKYTLTPDERTQYQRTRGQSTAKIMEEVMGTSWYKAMDGTAQAEVLNWIGNFSNFIAKKEMLEARGVDYSSNTYDKYYSALTDGTPAADVVASKYGKQVAAAEETAAAETIIAEAKIPEASREEAETMSAEAKRFYAGFLKGGVSDATARKLATELEGSDASGHEQWRMIYKSAGNEGEKAVTSVMTDDMKRNWELAKDAGCSMDDYIKVREDYLDLDENGKQKQAEWNATLDQFTFSENEAEDKRIKGTLWQIVTGSGSTKNNPYDKDAGQKVIDAKAKGGSGSGSYAPARIPTLRLPDIPKAEKPSSGLRIRAAAPAQAPRSGLRIRAK